MSFCVRAAAQETAGTSTEAGVPVNFHKLKAVTDSLIRNYDFTKAASLYEEAKAGADSLDAVRIDEEMVQAQNGMNMARYCSSPVPVAVGRFSMEDFFLYYPLPDKSWRKVPNQLDSIGNDAVARAVYVPENADRLFWSAKDQDGIRNIYSSQFRDTVWTAPSLLNEQLTSSSNEIYPMLSTDGKQLFFASEGLYGMGGYDLYVSTWDESTNDWGVPVNMGFPYSSPYDDFLFINTSDGKYSMFASNRACPADSVDIYVLEFDSTPVRKAVESPEELRKLCALAPENSADANSGVSAGDNVGGNNAAMRRYYDKIMSVRALRDSIYTLGTSGGDAAQYLPALKDSLAKATRELQSIEMEFLRNGISIDPERLQHEPADEKENTSAGYAFSRKSLGGSLHLEMEQPEPSFDYTFQILPQGRFAEDNTLPGGLIYQIQLFSMYSKATVKQIKGLSPVFEREAAGGKRIYSVGVFRSYKDVLANLNRVKRTGFRSAIITAYLNGSPITVQKARTLEKSVHELFQIRIFPDNGNTLTETAINAVKAVTDVDMARTVEGGIVSYLLGPYDDRAEAEMTAKALKAAGVSNLRMESAGMSEAK